jgi:predicted SnoaL-like aldol condensation-catalyzing enzyme
MSVLDQGTRLDQGTEYNRRVAVDFLNEASAGRAQQAWERYGSRAFVHHNPWFPSDGPSLVAAMDDNARHFPQKELEVLRTVAEGDLVVVHSRVRHEPQGSDSALTHIFRFEDGRIRELWDIGMELPADSPNEIGMF